MTIHSTISDGSTMLASMETISHGSTLLASMTIHSTISPFVIDDNTHEAIHALSRSCSPFHHSTLPLWHQWQRVSTCLELLPFSFSSLAFIWVTVFYSTLSIMFLSPPVIMLCLLLLSSCSPIIMLFLIPLSWCFFQLLSSPLLLRAKGTLPDVFILDP